jgi:hypothetical protein
MRTHLMRLRLPQTLTVARYLHEELMRHVQLVIVAGHQRLNALTMLRMNPEEGATSERIKKIRV